MMVSTASPSAPKLAGPSMCVNTAWRTMAKARCRIVRVMTIPSEPVMLSRLRVRATWLSAPAGRPP